MEKKFICIRCPQGCEITTTLDGYGAITEITGNSCKLGIEYVTEELNEPKRTLTTTIAVTGGKHPLVPVWTERPVPKDKVLEIAGMLRSITVEAPVAINQIVVENVLDTGVNIVASSSVDNSFKD